MTTQPGNKARSERLKQLREAHPATFANTQLLLKSQQRIQQEIRKSIKEQPQTVPQIAAAAGIPSHEALFFLAALKKYGLVVEDGMQEDYPLYRGVEEK